MKRYENLLSPIQIGGVLLKNRMIATPFLPHYIQGTEPYPTEKVITTLINRAKNGAAAVALNHIEPASPSNHEDGFYYTDEGKHFARMDPTNLSTHAYLTQIIDGIHNHGAIVSCGAMGWYSNRYPMLPEEGPRASLAENKSMPSIDHVGHMTKKDIQEYIEDTVKTARLMKSVGFEMLHIYGCYNAFPAGQFPNPRLNNRTDEYGQNRFLLLAELLEAVKGAVGRDFPIELIWTAEEPGGFTVADSVDCLKYCEGLFDWVHCRNWEMDQQHAVNFHNITRENPSPNLEAAAALRAGLRAKGIKTPVAVSTALQNPDFNEKIIADGKADIICMARAWMADPEYGKKIYEGRGEDVTPCLKCNKCHVPGASDRFISYCPVNPVLGIEDKVDRMVAPIGPSKRVAVVGGGPAGMEAAIICADRGHKVTLYEQQSKLGGQLAHTDYASFKWPQADFKNWQIAQCEKKGVEIKLNTKATKEMLEAEGYDEVIVAVGPKLYRPEIEGVEGDNVMFAIDTYGREDLPGKIALIGGSETGVETAIYLSDCGCEVTLLTRQSILAPDAPTNHYAGPMRRAFERAKGTSAVYNVKKYVRIDEKGLVYIDADGAEQRVEADLIVLATGVSANPEEAGALYSSVAQRTQYIGDCVRPGDIHKATANAFGAASQI